MLQRASRLLRAGRIWTSLDVRPYVTPLRGNFYLFRAYSSKTKVSDPLRILFCGSDDFSGASLRALHEEHQKNPSLIESIDVVVRPGKPTGRGLKVIREPPVKALAAELGLPVHERDTFTGWDMPDATNLIVAVSFGLFVPPRLLRAARYGGLNVHPSLLPAYRGPAPLHHLLLDGIQTTGVSLQTLDEEKFDHGVILARQDLIWPDSLRRKVPRDCTVQQLQDAVAPLGAKMLVEGLQKGLHVPPLKDVLFGGRPPRILGELPHAPKITSWDRQVFAARVWPKTLARRQRILGPLWLKARGLDGQFKRIIIDEIEEVDCSRTDSPKEEKRDIWDKWGEYNGSDYNGSDKKTQKQQPINNKRNDLGLISTSPRTYGKFVYRKMLALYEAPPPSSKGKEAGGGAADGEPAGGGAADGEPTGGAPADGEPAATAKGQKPPGIHYWTVEGDDAIYISPSNPPNEQTRSYARIPWLKVEGEPAKPAAQVAAFFSVVARLPTLAWERHTRMAHKVDFDLHVASELQRLIEFTARFDLLEAERNGTLREHRMTLAEVLDEYNGLLQTIAKHWKPGNKRDKSHFRGYRFLIKKMRKR